MAMMPRNHFDNNSAFRKSLICLYSSIDEVPVRWTSIRLFHLVCYMKKLIIGNGKVVPRGKVRLIILGRTFF